MYHSPIVFFLFSLFFYSHFNGAFNDAEHTPIGIQDRAKLLSGTDRCVLKYVERMNGRKSFPTLLILIQRCALSEYFRLEEYKKHANDSSIFTLFPVFQHSHLQKCNSFLFFGTSSYEMTAEMEIVRNSDFQLLNCKYLILDKRVNLHGLKNFVVLPELSETHLNDILLKFKDDKDHVIEHLHIFELLEMENIFNKLLNLRRIYSLTVCQITIRVPTTIEKDKVWKFVEDILKNDNYILLNAVTTESYTELYMYANNEYQCMMRYV